MSYLIKDLSGNPVEQKGNKLLGSDSYNVVKGVNPESRTLTIIGTDETRDRHGDIVMVNGWILDNYLKNPVFLWAHDYSSVPIGAATKLVRRKKPDPRMEFTIKFPTEGLFPFADLIFNLYNEKVINASSVGFIPYKWEDIHDEDEDTKNMYWCPKRFLKQELLELSGCAVPANPSALQNSLPDEILRQINEGPVIPENNKDYIMEEIKSIKAEIKDMEGRTLVPVSKDISEKVEDPMDINELLEERDIEVNDTVASKSDKEDNTENENEVEIRPFPNEHSCDLSSKEYEKYRRESREHDGKTYSVLYGKVKDEDKWEEASYRYNKKTWDRSAARKHCKSHGGTFEPASSDTTDSFEEIDLLYEVKEDLKNLISNSEKILEAFTKSQEKEPSGQEKSIDPKKEAQVIDDLVKDAAKGIDDSTNEEKEDDEFHLLLDRIKLIKGQFDKLADLNTEKE